MITEVINNYIAGRFVFLVTGILIFNVCLSQTQYSLYSEDFEAGAGTYNVYLNLGSTISTNKGSNQWIINNSYNGGGTYPNTVQQNITSGGTITNAPTSTYLHIHNSASAIKNANYNTSDSSDRMAIITSVCTNGFTNVKLNFFWLGEGKVNDHVRIYYSTDFSTWNLAPASVGGTTIYNSNGTTWKEETITSSSFENVSNLYFAFRWVNDGSGGLNKISFGVDDISITGEDVGTATITSIVNTDSICIGSGGALDYIISDMLCSGTYILERANNAAFTSGVVNLGYPILGTDTIGSVYISFPPGTTPGCYYFRLNRADKPAITGIPTVACVVAYDCPVTGATGGGAGGPGPSNILTHTPYPDDTACRGSFLPMSFLSYGTFNVGNQYILEGDTSADFSSPLLRTIGSITDANQYPNPMMPGSVSGLIPTDWPKGCNYKFRIRSTDPPALFTVDSNYCINACPIITNALQNISACVTEFTGDTIVIPYSVDSTSNGVTFAPPNEFQVQVIDPMMFTIINTGGLGIDINDTSGNIIITVPSGTTLGSLGLGPGGYFLRIVSTNPSDTNNGNGTIVNLVIGYPINKTNIFSSIFSGFDYICPSPAATFAVFPSPNRNFSAGSTYDYSFNGFPWIEDLTGGVSVIYNGAPGNLEVCVREHNGDCYGPWACDTVIALGAPDVNIIAPNPVCAEQPQKFEVPKYPGSNNYSWYIDNELQPFGSNSAWLRFPAPGSYKVKVVASNSCGSSSKTITVTVEESLYLQITQDTFICYGESIELSMWAPYGIYSWWIDDTIPLNVSDPYITVSPDSTTTYWGHVDAASGCQYHHEPVLVTVAPEIKIDTVPVICAGGSVTLFANGGNKYTWSDPNGTLSNIYIADPVASPKESTVYTVFVEDTLHNCSGEASIEVIVIDSTTEIHYICDLEIFQLSAPKGAVSYLWNTGEQTQNKIVIGDITDPIAYYTVNATGPSKCTSTKTYQVITDKDCFPVVFIPNAFTPNLDGLNDFLSIASKRLAEDWKISIYERRGNKIYEGQQWDGIAANGKIMEGVVIVRLEGISKHKLNDAGYIDPAGQQRAVSIVQNVLILRD